MCAKEKMEDEKDFEIKSQYNQDEDFDYRDVPTKFETVKSQDINRLSGAIVGFNRHNFEKFEPRAFRQMLENASGRFADVYNIVESDYVMRKNNLSQAYEDGMADVDARLSDLKLLADEYRTSFEIYAEIYEKFYGRRPNDNLSYEALGIDEMEEDCKKIRQWEEKK